MNDRAMAILTITVLGIFLGLLIQRVPRLDLGVIVGVSFLLVVYDFFLSPTRVGRK